MSWSRKSYEERLNGSLKRNPTAIQLLQIISRKKSNLSVALDVTTTMELLALAEQLGPFICVLKTHIDILEDFTPELPGLLMALAKKFDFLIFEDRKFADIGNTVKLQYGKGVYRIAEWSNMTNAHPIPGEGIISGLKQVGGPLGRGLLILAEMSSAGSLATGSYTTEAVKMAVRHKDFCIGFIGQYRMASIDGSVIDDDFIYMTPGVAMVAKGDQLGQQYRTPYQVIVEGKSDVIIVGRGIYGAGDVIENARAYQKAGWDAYLESLSQK